MLPPSMALSVYVFAIATLRLRYAHRMGVQVEGVEPWFREDASDQPADGLRSVRSVPPFKLAKADMVGVRAEPGPRCAEQPGREAR